MDVQTFRDLQMPPGQEILQAARALAPREADFLTHYTVLSRRYPASLARAALETVILREKAVLKFPQASQMYFTREALEQATGSEVSAYRAERYRLHRLVVDLGCSIGGDTLALAGAAPVIGIDIDPLRLAMAAANIRNANPSDVSLSDSALFIQADLTSPLPLSPFPSSLSPALFFDPARRSGHRRAFSVNDYTPPLAIIQEWLPYYPALGVKISPGVNLEELSAYISPAQNVEVEFISLRGELKEAALWFGPLRSASRRATLLPGPYTLIQGQGDLQVGLSDPLAYLYEPDAAVLRAGLVKTLGSYICAAQLDPEIAYLTAAQKTPTPFARVWAVEDWFPFSLKRLRSYLRERGIGRVTVKKRGSPITPEKLIHDLRLKGDLERVVFLTQLRGKPVAIIASSGPISDAWVVVES
jgi:SAM-dependent methyltransferase